MLLFWLHFILFLPYSASVLICLWPWESSAIKFSVCCLLSRSQGLHCPSIMDDSAYCYFIPLALLLLIGLKRVYLDSTSLVTDRVYVSIVWAWYLIKTGHRQDSPQASGIDLACRLCLTVWLSLENGVLMLKKIAHWHSNWHDSRFPCSCCHGNL